MRAKSFHFLCATLVAFSIAIADPSLAFAQAVDVTAHVERLGNPGKLTYPSDEKAFARNVWVLKAFEGRLYVGIGNRDNAAPAANAGPVDIWSFDPGKGFVKEWTAPDEQVEVFRVIDGQLVVPGNDPREPWELGNFYRLEKDGWKKHRTIPKGVHAFDMIKFGGVLYAALGTEAGAVVVASDDDGTTWREFPLLPVARGYYARAHSFFVLNRRLYVSATGLMGSRTFVLVKGSFLPMRKSDFFPGVDRPHHVFAHAYTPFLGQAVYLGRERVLLGHPRPVGLFAAADAQNVRAVALLAGAVPRDIATESGRLAVLWTMQSRDGYDNHVFETRDLTEWRAAFRFHTSTFVRAMEIFGGDFYFGLGAHPDRVHSDTGEILRLRAQHVPAN
jgi:hypothetical protein